jgi:superfamily II DNA or RNA helicase
MTRIIVSNEISIYDLPPVVKQRLRDELNFTYSERVMRYGELVYESRVYPVCREGNPFVVPYGSLDVVRDILPTADYEYKTSWWIPLALAMDWTCTLQDEDDRDFQTECKRAMYESFRRKLYGMTLIAPCGSGKTRLGLSLLAELGQPTLVVVHTKELQQQWVDRAREAFPKLAVSTIGDGKFDQSGSIVVGLVQTLAKRPEEISSAFSVVIFDEVHHVPAETFARVANAVPATVKIGLTASATRSDGLHPLMFAIIGPIVNRVEQRDLNQANVTMPPEVHWVTTGWTWNGDAAAQYTKMMTDLVNDQLRNEILVEKILDLKHEGRKILVLSARVAHLKNLEGMCSYHHNTTQLITGKEPDKKRKEAMARMVAGFPCTFATIQIAKEGLDAPLLDTIVFATPFRDPITAQQAVGRIQRVAEGKQTPLVIDFIDEVGVLQSQAHKRNLVYRKLQAV